MANKKGRSNTGPPFIQLFKVVKRSRAYHGLSSNARAALIELMDRYNGSNNGFIGLGVRELAYELGCSPTTAGRALRELDDARLAHPTTLGAWRGKQATEWRLTFYRCDRTLELPIRNLKARQRFTGETQSVTGEHRTVQSVTGEPHKRKNPINHLPQSVMGDTHIDIYHRDTGSGAGAVRAKGLPSLPTFLDRRKAERSAA